MSEYASSKSYENNLVPASVGDRKYGNVALFDSTAELEARVERVTNPDAYADHEVLLSDPVDTTPSLVEEGASVRLTDRAIAISNVIDAINIENRYDGAAKAAATPYSSFNMRNGSGRLSGMRHNAELAVASERRNIETLVATDALRRAGFSEDWQVAVRSAVRQEIEKDAQPGKAPHRRREKRRKKARRSADNSTK